MTGDERQKLRDAALAAVNGTRSRSDARRTALAADWKLQTSNSFRRIGAHGDGDVLCGTKHPHDGHPDLLAAPGVLDYMVAAQPRVVIQLLDDVSALEDKFVVVGTVGALVATIAQLGTNDPQALTKALQIVEQINAALRETSR